MQIILTPEESEQYFYDALCNGLGYCFSAYGLALEYTDEAYAAAKDRLKTKEPAKPICTEDVYMEILKGGDDLSVIDYNDNEKKIPITIQQVHEKVCTCPPATLLQMAAEEDDATTASVILQTVIFGEVLYG